jgi:hypothetical protein
MLSKQGAGYEIKKKDKVRHFFWMNDLNLFSIDEAELQQELTIF